MAEEFENLDAILQQDTDSPNQWFCRIWRRCRKALSMKQTGR